jgi:hypothetical protein
MATIVFTLPMLLEILSGIHVHVKQMPPIHCFFKDACPGKEHCTKYLKRKRSDEHPEIYYYKESKETIRLKAPDIQSLRNGVLVRNAKYGDGVILEILKDEMLTVQFHDKVLTFLYPSAFQDGKLRIVNQKK